MKPLRDKVAVITGGASGIGRAIGLVLAERGTHVVVADVEEPAAEAAAAEIASKGVRALAVGCDVANEDSVAALAERAWKEMGRVDLLFNNAGVAGGTQLLDSTRADLEWLFSVNVFGVWYGCKVFGRRFVEQGTPAHIVNTGSEHSLCLPHPGAGFYTASKHAVLGISDVLRRELPSHVGVSVLCPGVVKTRIWDADRNRPGSLGEAATGAPKEMVHAVIDSGKDALEIGRRAVEGVERGDFYIVTHSHVRDYVEARVQEIRAAFDAQAPRPAEDARYDMMRIIANLTDTQE